MPELAEAGYTALWLPPPFKGTSVWDVGFGTFDRFDLGDKDQSGTIPTKYGTAAELQNLIETAHRFGLRVYFDNVMAHNGGPIPGSDENTSIYAQPGFVPEDFHLQRTSDGYYRNWPGIEWEKKDEWQILNRNPFGQDIAHENPNTSFGLNENDDFPKYVGIRQPNNPEYYPDTDLPIAITRTSGNFTTYPFANKEPFNDSGYLKSGSLIGAGNGRFDWDDTDGDGQHDSGEISEAFTDTGVDPLTPSRNTAAWGFGDGKYNMGNPVPEDVNAMLIRAFRWFTDQYKPDGYRLDAVKHVPNYFFGEMSASTKDSSNAGYLGEANVQFNLTRGFSDWNNHRDTTFSDNPRDDLFYYGEHLGPPTEEGPYLAAGMRIANDTFLNTVKDSALGKDFIGLDSEGFKMYGGVNTGMKYPMSHDNSSIWAGHKELAFLLTYLTAGPGIIYTDGYNQSTGPNYFPKIAQLPFLGQFDSSYATNILSIYQNFGRGNQVGKYSTNNFAAFERWDKTENATMSDADGTVLLVMLGRYGVFGGQNPDAWSTTFPVGSRLKNYSYHGGPFYVNVDAQGKIRDDSGNVVLVDGGKYFAFSWDNPELPLVWKNSPASDVSPITITQNGQPVSRMTYLSPDGVDGDANLNAGGRSIPRVTSGSNLSFHVRADGSAENVMLKLNGGMDLNSHMNLGSTNADKRDNPPALSRETFLGYEQMRYVQRVREKFAAAVTQSNNIIGSSGSVTWRLGSSGAVAMNPTGDSFNYSGYWPSWVYHDPSAANAPVSNGGALTARQLETNGGTITLRAKVGSSFQWDKAWVYYTLTNTTNSTYPEGSAGFPGAGAQVAEMTWYANQMEGSATNDWIVATGLPVPLAGQELRYKIGVAQTNVASVFPSTSENIRVKQRMETVFSITNFNAATARYRPHNDYGKEQTNGLTDGFHVLRARAFLQRPGRAAIYNTFVQPFYYDTQRPLGEILYPTEGETLGSASYEAVVRTDSQTTEVWYRIADGDARNDDSPTGKNNGNGAWVKASRAAMTTALAKTIEKEWRFNYANIPSTGSATLQVRLRELSSSTDMALTDDTVGHFTTLTRTVTTRAPSFAFLFPSTNGAVLGTNYTVKVGVDKTLTSGLSDDQIKDRFALKITSRGGLTLPRSSFTVVRNETSSADAIGFNLPNLNNGIPSTVDTLEATWLGTTPPLTAVLTFKPDTNGPVVPFLEFATPTNNGLAATINNAPGNTNTVVEIRTAAVVSNAPTLTTTPFLTILSPSTGSLEPGNETKLWTFQVSGLQANNYVFTASSGAATNNLVVTVGFPDPANPDDDGDGLSDAIELTAGSFPQTSTDSWNNGQVHLANISGKSSPLLADTDGDGLSDALELGWRSQGDLDPPLYAVLEHAGIVPGVGSASRGDDRSRLAFGSTTDPAKTDTDGDGISDGIEDANGNGWTDGDGKPLQLTATIAQYTNSANRPNTGDWPNQRIDSWETWTETSPNKWDSDNDGLGDGEEDADRDGQLDSGETDPRKWDTDGDGLADKWEKDNKLDPWDDGSVADFQNLAGLPGLTSNPNGGTSDPDGDGRSNLQEQAAGTNPLVADFLLSQPTNSGAAPLTDDDYGAFIPWNYEDLIAHDDHNIGYNLAGTLDSVDIYRLDGNDSSRDIVAFSFRDGGSTDGKVYFRVDFFNLQPGSLSDVNTYIVVDTGNPAVGECALPEDVGLGTDMRWEAVVGAYRSKTDAPARVFIDTDLKNNTRNGTDSLASVQSRGIATNGVAWVRWSSRFDAVTVAVQRQALLDAGWNGDPNRLGFQVFTTLPGSGSAVNANLVKNSIAKNNDLTDTIADDWLTSDFWKDQQNINLNGKLSWYFGRDVSLGNNGNKYSERHRYAKVMLLAHGNQAIQPASVVQNLVHNRAPTNPAGYYRLLDTHESYGAKAPLSLHITPTLASALQWAKSTDNSNDGPAFNTRIRNLAASANLDLVGSSFSDHVAKYFNQSFNNQNRDLARQFLGNVYGISNTVAFTNVFWPSERVLDKDTLAQIAGMGYTHTFADQMRHLSLWFGLPAATGTDGFRLNRINGVTLIPISDTYSDYLANSLDEGSVMEFRQMVNRRSRSSVQDQVTVLWRDLSDFTDSAKASNYDANVRWLASRPYVRVVTPSQILAGQVQYPRLDNGQLTGTWGVVERGTNNQLPTVAKDWVHRATQGNYDNWYEGSANEEGLQNKTFPGTTGIFGRVGVSGIAHAAATNVNTVTRTGLPSLARAVLHGAMFQTAFHDTATSDLRKFSTGEYVSPDTGTNQALASFARFAQSQARFARVYGEVNAWSQTGAYRRYSNDVDLDGQAEYILSNQRIFALFEATGGRMVAAWMRLPDGSHVWQMTGNFASYSGTDTEDEGASNLVGTTTTLSAFRTSGFKDWWMVRTGVSSNAMANSSYTVSPVAGTNGLGWQFASGGVKKTIRLPNVDTERLEAVYEMINLDKGYVRFGLSPNLEDLLLNGQTNLSNEATQNHDGRRRLVLQNTNPAGITRISVWAPQINDLATDSDNAGFSTVTRRNQAQTHQVEVELTGSGPHRVTLAFDQGMDLTNTTGPDSDLDGLPDWWESDNFLGNDFLNNPAFDGTADPDEDGLTDLQEYQLQTNPNDGTSGPERRKIENTEYSSTQGFSIRMKTYVGLKYQLQGISDLNQGWEIQSNIEGEKFGDGTIQTFRDTNATNSTRKFYRVVITPSP